jgi:threonine/homoserine/homoserine lactone efflux protein
LGAIYLVWLGAKLLGTKMGDAPVLELKPHHYMRQALVITLFNPKAIVFYMAFFPLFVNPAVHQGLVTFAAMAATIAVLTFAYGLVLVLLAHFLAARIRGSAVATFALNKTAGLLLIVFGLKLALSK